uniref:Cytochrome P450 n=1 Tax=Glossina pallidipes TaxID=7398 RepID=A0A1B0A805_GLOPL
MTCDNVLLYTSSLPGIEGFRVEVTFREMWPHIPILSPIWVMGSLKHNEVKAESVLLTKTVKFISGYSPITVFLTAALIVFLVIYNKRRARLVRLIDKIPGPSSLPFLGNAIELNVDHDGK